MRNLNRPAPSEPNPNRPRSGRGEAVCGSFPPCAADPDVPVCPELPAVPCSDVVVPVVAEVPAPVWPVVDGVVADVLPWPVVEVEPLWLEGCCAVVPCVPELVLELLPPLVCAARHKLASRRGEASQSFLMISATSVTKFLSSFSIDVTFPLANSTSRHARA